MGNVETTSETNTDPARPTIDVQVWSDVVCPWCYIGKRRFDRALAEVGDDLGVDVAVTYRAYQLDPTASPGAATPVSEAYARKFGGPERAAEILAHVTRTAAEDGIEFRMDRALRANTLLAHRLLWWAGEQHSPVAQAALEERIMQAYFTDGDHIGDPDVLAGCAVDAGLDRDAALAFLESDGGVADVQAELAAAHENGITAVPTYVFADTWAVPGAQDSDTFVQVLRRMADKALADQR